MGGASHHHTEMAPETKQFISNLPNGDVDPQKCKELVSDMTAQLGSNSISNSMVVDSKYLYSKKLCLANIMITTGKNPNVSTTIQIFDLGSNEIFAEYSEDGNVKVTNEKLFLFGKEQDKPLLNIIGLWLALKEQF